MAFLRLVNNHNTHTLISAQYGNIEKLASKNTTQVFFCPESMGADAGLKETRKLPYNNGNNTKKLTYRKPRHIRAL